MSDSALKQDFDALFMRINRRDRRIAELEALRTANHELIADMEKDQKSLLLRVAELEAWQNFVRTYQPHVAEAADEELLGKESD